MTPKATKTIGRRYIDELNRRTTAILDDLVPDEFRQTVFKLPKRSSQSNRRLELRRLAHGLGLRL
jgi:hypothetical protein